MSQLPRVKAITQPVNEKKMIVSQIRPEKVTPIIPLTTNKNSWSEVKGSARVTKERLIWETASWLYGSISFVHDFTGSALLWFAMLFNLGVSFINVEVFDKNFEINFLVFWDNSSL